MLVQDHTQVYVYCADTRCTWAAAMYKLSSIYKLSSSTKFRGLVSSYLHVLFVCRLAYKEATRSPDNNTEFTFGINLVDALVRPLRPPSDLPAGAVRANCSATDVDQVLVYVDALAIARVTQVCAGHGGSCGTGTWGRNIFACTSLQAFIASCSICHIYASMSHAV